MIGITNGQSHLWGITNTSVFRSDIDGSNLQFYQYSGSVGSYGLGGVVLGNNGIFYAINDAGSICNDNAILYSFDPSSGLFTDIYDFDCSYGDYGWNPENSPMFASNGKLYGMTNYGGGANQGVIYEVDPITNIYTDIHDFEDSTGLSPSGTLIQLNDGKIYGTAVGGTNSAGVIFCYNPIDSTYTPLHYFDNTMLGNGPEENELIQASDGKLYGTTTNGGAYNNGVIFSFDVSTGVYSDIYDFDSLQGYDPAAGVIQATNGLLYGTNTRGGVNNEGNIYSYNISTNTYTDLYDFNQGYQYSPGTRQLLQASNGLLFGTMLCANCINNNYGIYYSFNISTDSFNILYIFHQDINGSFPDCHIIEVPDSVTTGIKPINTKNIISIYPNPATSTITIQQSNPSLHQQLLITDIMGKTIYTEPVNNSPQSTIDISEWSNGVYFYQLKGEKETVQGKFVKE